MERLVELRQVLRLDDDVEFAEAGRAEAQLAPRQTETLDLPLGPQVTEIFPHRLHENGVTHARLEVAPDVIEVHAAGPMRLRCRSPPSIPDVPRRNLPH